MTQQDDEFSDEAYLDFCELFDEGNELFAEEKYDHALNLFAEALQVIPEPKNEWEECGPLLAAIADVWFMKKDFDKCIDALTDAVQCPGANEVAYIHFRLGQAYFEKKEMDEAGKAFYQAHKINEDIFEDESPAYIDLLINYEK